MAIRRLRDLSKKTQDAFPAKKWWGNKMQKEQLNACVKRYGSGVENIRRSVIELERHILGRSNEYPAYTNDPDPGERLKAMCDEGDRLITKTQSIYYSKINAAGTARHISIFNSRIKGEVSEMELFVNTMIKSRRRSPVWRPWGNIFTYLDQPVQFY